MCPRLRHPHFDAATYFAAKVLGDGRIDLQDERTRVWQLDDYKRWTAFLNVDEYGDATRKAIKMRGDNGRATASRVIERVSEIRLRSCQPF